MEVTHSIEKGYLSVDEVSKYLGVKASTIRNWAKERKIPAYKAGRMWRFKKEEIDAWMEGHRGDGTVVDKMVKRVLETAKNLARNPKPDIDGVIRKAIEETRRDSYNDNYGRPDQIKGLRKEVNNGNL